MRRLSLVPLAIVTLLVVWVIGSEAGERSTESPAVVDIGRGGVVRALLSDDGTVVAVTVVDGDDRLVRILDRVTGGVVEVPGDLADLSADGDRVLTEERNTIEGISVETIRVHDRRNGSSERLLTDTGVTGFFLTDGRIVLGNADDRWQLRSGATTVLLPESDPRPLGAGPAGTIVVDGGIAVGGPAGLTPVDDLASFTGIGRGDAAARTAEARIVYQPSGDEVRMTDRITGEETALVIADRRPPTGFTVRIVGDSDTWQVLVRGQTPSGPPYELFVVDPRSLELSVVATDVDAQAQPVGSPSGQWGYVSDGELFLTPLVDAATTPTPTTPPEPTRSGYWLLDRDGGLYAFGDATEQTDIGTSPAVAIESTVDGGGAWILTGDGVVHTRGSAAHHGDVDLATLAPGEQVSALSARTAGDGYWVFTDLGRAIPFGVAEHLGEMFGTPLNGPIVASRATPSGLGYWMVGSDGGIFSFGDARFHGSMGGVALNAPVVGIAPDPDGEGYWLVASDGGIFAFDAAFLGSMGSVPLNAPVVGAISRGNGYLLLGSDGGVFNFSDEPFSGSLGDDPPSAPVVGVAAFVA
ncbi:MAG: hypothetical protein AAGD18_14490 [Actinomycetota bacterium]